MSYLSGKRILMFSPKFFNYENIIIDEIIAEGGIVHYYDERNNPSAIKKILIRKAHFLLNHSISKYYGKVIDNEKKFNPDFVFFISPETVNKNSIIKLKKTFPKAKFILHMWDSIENKNAKKIYKEFDSCSSFDQLDCKKYNFSFRPLFFSKQFEKKNTMPTSYKYDFSFIGSIHSDRAKILNQIRKECLKKNLNFFYYLYIPGKLMLIMRKLIDKNVRELSNFLYTNSMSKEEVSNILKQTNYVIDINHPKQVGLTMRTIEMLGLHRKLLTTNSYIREYDFYNEKNQIVINRDNVIIDENNILLEYIDISDEIYNKYRLYSWLNDILQ